MSFAASATVTVAALPVVLPEVPETLPVTFPVRGPANPLAVRTPVLELKLKVVTVFTATLPAVLVVVNSGKQVVSVDSLSMATLFALVAVVAVSALPTSAPVKVVAPTEVNPLGVAVHSATPAAVTPRAICPAAQLAGSANRAEAVEALPVRAPVNVVAPTVLKVAAPPDPIEKARLVTPSYPRI